MAAATRPDLLRTAAAAEVRGASQFSLVRGAWRQTAHWHVICIVLFVCSCAFVVQFNSGRSLPNNDKTTRQTVLYNSSTPIYIHIYIYIYTHTYTFICMYIYIYIHILRISLSLSLSLGASQETTKLMVPGT